MNDRIKQLTPEKIAAYLEQTGWHFYAQTRSGDRKYGLDKMLLPTVLKNKDSVAWLPVTTELIKKIAKKENWSVEDVVEAISYTEIPEEYEESGLPLLH